MIDLVRNASLNIESKYVLEKVKLKKVLQLIHTEINENPLVQLQLSGGLHKDNEYVGSSGQRMSVQMS